MSWIKYKARKPPLGRKVQCFGRGDVWCGMRIGNVMICSTSPFFTGIDPELWQEIDFPKGFTGDMRVSVDDKKDDNVLTMTLEEWEKKNLKFPIR